jgi:hypothetical protein
VLEGYASEPDRDGGEHDQPGQALIGVEREEGPLAQAAPEAAQKAGDDADPVSAKEPQEGDRGAHVQRDDKCQVERAAAVALRGLGH